MECSPKSFRRRVTVRIPTTTPTLEAVVDAVIEARERGKAPLAQWATLVETILHFRPRQRRAVILGGGTGMSTIIGGNVSTMLARGRLPLSLKTEFERLDAVTCVTDDGGSTGELLKYFPIIGIGDLRKSCTALMSPERLQDRYGVTLHDAVVLMRMIHRIFEWRFLAQSNPRRFVRDPVSLLPAAQRQVFPPPLRDSLRAWGVAFDELARIRRLPLTGHCLGNLLLVGALYCAGWRLIESSPSAKVLQRALDSVAAEIGAPVGALHAATHVPGQLCFRYANGVEVIGQSKAGRARRGFPIDFVYGLYVARPVVSVAVRRALSQADVIIYAPGSLYSSMIPVLQLPEIVQAIRANWRALKILVANFWIQEGETDISPQQFGRGFFVSDLLKAYEQNVPGGTRGLFDVVLCSNLEHLPGNVLRNYALEGKHPIHLDRREVESMGYNPVETVLFTVSDSAHPGVIHHDAEKFAVAVRTLVYIAEHAAAQPRWWARQPVRGRGAAPSRSTNARPRFPGKPLCQYRRVTSRILAMKQFSHAAIRHTLEKLLWMHCDIRPEHLVFFKRARIVNAARWGRNVEWDNVLGYYEPRDETIMLHETLLKDESRLGRDLLITLGESLLGNYIERREWTDMNGTGRCYSIRLRPPELRRGYLSDEHLRHYLKLARLTPDPTDHDLFRIIVNDREGFLPPGLLFGLLYAWYLDNACGGVMEYEMSLLRWPESALIPYQARERRRKEALIAFFRTRVFQH